jgi:ArsR family transcriptional regulator
MLRPERFYSCLSDPVRLASMTLLRAEGELCVCELVVALKENQSKVSRHLAQLRNCSLLQDRRQGQWVHYSLHPDLPPWALTVLDLTARADTALLSDMQERLRAMSSRPERAA